MSDVSLVMAGEKEEDALVATPHFSAKNRFAAGLSSLQFRSMQVSTVRIKASP